MLEGVLAMTTNQPTDATLFKSALYAQCPEPVADDIWQRFESLTAQLAAVQAEAKALEAWGEQQHKAHEHLMVIYRHGQVRGIARRAYETPKPQPVDASSLARIARVALDAKVYIMRASNLEDSGWRNAIPPLTASSDALTPDDIALAQALAGGA